MNRVAGERAVAGHSGGPADAALGASLRELLEAVLDRVFGLALSGIERLAETLEGFAARGGIGLSALLGGAAAAVSGRNPVWGAIKGAVSALSGPAKAALIIVLVLALILLPVTVLLVLLALLVAAVVAVVRHSSS
jgi:hypothetical protein